MRETAPRPHIKRLGARCRAKVNLLPDRAKGHGNAAFPGVPAGRFGTREEIAHAVSFFASDEAAFVTSLRLVVDGGRALS